jgi:hypothetical protein
MPPDYATHACPAFLADFSDFVDGGLPPARHAELQAHLDCCEGCLQHLRAYRHGIAAYREIGDLHTDANEFWLGMRIRLASDVATPPARRVAWRAPAMAGAAMALVALATVWLGTRIDAGFERVAERGVVMTGPTPAATEAGTAPGDGRRAASGEAVSGGAVEVASASTGGTVPAPLASRAAPVRTVQRAAAGPEFEALREEIELAGWLGDPYLAASSRASFESGGVRIRNASLTY